MGIVNQVYCMRISIEVYFLMGIRIVVYFVIGVKRELALRDTFLWELELRYTLL